MSCQVLSGLDPHIQRVHRYVTEEKFYYCVYVAPHEQMVREHARQGGFPASRVSEVKSVIDPTTSEKEPVPRLTKELEAWRVRARAPRLMKPDADTTRSMRQGGLGGLRSLGDSQ
jgi:hypothetical protein